MNERKATWIRRLKILRLLAHTDHVSTARAARHVGASRPIALSDLQGLRDHGVPVDQHGSGQETTWRLDQSWHGPADPTDVAEDVALGLSNDAIQAFLGGTVWGESAQRLTDRLRTWCSTQAEQEILQRKFHMIPEPAKSYRDSAPILATVTDAILGQYRLSLSHHEAREPGKFKDVKYLMPLSLCAYKRGLYLTYWPSTTMSSRNLALDRVFTVTPHPERTFQYPAQTDYSPSRESADRFGLHRGDQPPAQVVIEFAREVATYVKERDWMPAQEVIDLADGRCQLRFRATGLELVTLILGFGDKAKVLAPEWLVTKVRTELAAALASYS